MQKKNDCNQKHSQKVMIPLKFMDIVKICHGIDELDFWNL